MSFENSEKFNILVQLIKEVKPSLSDYTVKPDELLTEALGLDSLDMLQLARKVRKKLDSNFDLDAWAQSLGTQGRSVASLLNSLPEATTQG